MRRELVIAARAGVSPSRRMDVETISRVGRQAKKRNGMIGDVGGVIRRRAKSLRGVVTYSLSARSALMQEKQCAGGQHCDSGGFRNLSNRPVPAFRPQVIRVRKWLFPHPPRSAVLRPGIVAAEQKYLRVALEVVELKRQSPRNVRTGASAGRITAMI